MQQVPVRRGKATDAGPRRVDVKGASRVGVSRDGASGEAEVTRRLNKPRFGAEMSVRRLQRARNASVWWSEAGAPASAEVQPSFYEMAHVSCNPPSRHQTHFRAESSKTSCWSWTFVSRHAVAALTNNLAGLH